VRQAFVAAAVFGRDEEDSVMGLRQADVDNSVTVMSAGLGGMPFPFPLQEPHSEFVLNISVR
jgi:hypothetical protein